MNATHVRSSTGAVRVSVLIAAAAAAAMFPTAPADAKVSDQIVVCSEGTTGKVTVLNSATGAAIVTLVPFGANTGGHTVAVGDIDNDGIDDLIVGRGKASAKTRVRIYDGNDLLLGNPNIAPVADFQPFANSVFGIVHVAAGNTDGIDGDDLFVGTSNTKNPSNGSKPVSTVNMYRFANLSFTVPVPTAIQPFGAADRNGVTVATGNVGGDASIDLVCGQSASAQSVRAFDGDSLGGVPATLFTIASPFGGGYAKGVYVAVGDVGGTDASDDLVIGQKSTSTNVVVYDTTTVVPTVDADTPFLAYPTKYTTGVRVGVNYDSGFGYIMTGPGSGKTNMMGWHVTPFADDDQLGFNHYYTFIFSTSTKGMFVGGGQ